jgi:nucleotide-binding universal stress UspA family protein
MRIKPMLLRLQSALGQDNLSQQMLLYPGAVSGMTSDRVDSEAAIETFDPDSSDSANSDPTNVVISYSGSPNSQTALDFAFWIAHQTKLSTNKAVTVHVVYVLDSCNSLDLTCAAASDLEGLRSQNLQKQQVNCFAGQTTAGQTAKKKTATATQTKARSQAVLCKPQAIQSRTAQSLTQSLETADRVLWQARCLADEWRGSLEAHLRFGAVAIELRQVVESVKADVLLVGCTDGEHTLIQQLLAPDFPCPILGIPHELEKL